MKIPVAIRVNHSLELGARMMGIAYNHPELGHSFVVTSPIVKLEAKTGFVEVTTRTGTVYHAFAV